MFSSFMVLRHDSTDIILSLKRCNMIPVTIRNNPKIVEPSTSTRS